MCIERKRERDLFKGLAHGIVETGKLKIYRAERQAGMSREAGMTWCCFSSPNAIWKNSLFLSEVNLLTFGFGFCFCFFFFSFIYLIFYFTILYWFCHTLTWICHGCISVPQLEPPSHLPPHPISLGHPSAPAPSTLYHALSLDWWFISHMIIYMFQCHSPISSLPCPLPQSPKDCSIHLCLFCCLVTLSFSTAWKKDHLYNGG